MNIEELLPYLQIFHEQKVLQIFRLNYSKDA
jgi:hypothetical protein